MYKRAIQVDFSNGLLSEKIKKRVEKLNLHKPLPSNLDGDKIVKTGPNLDAKEETTETPSYSVSNSLADRLGKDSPSTGQNNLYRRQQRRRGKNRRAREGLRGNRKLYKRPMLKSLETRRGIDYDYDESFLPLVAKGKRNRKRNKEMPLRQN